MPQKDQRRGTVCEQKCGSPSITLFGPAGLVEQQGGGGDDVAGPQHDQPASSSGPRAQGRIAGAIGGSSEQLERAVGLPGGCGCLTSGARAAGAGLAVRRQLGRPIQGARGRGVATAGGGGTGGPLQLCRDLLVRADRGSREVPGPRLPRQRRGQRAVRRPPLPARRPPPDDAAHERMCEDHAAAAHPDPAADLGLVERRDVRRACRRGRGEETEVAVTVRGDEQQELPGRGAERRRAPGDDLLYPRTGRQRAGRAARGRPAARPSASQAAPPGHRRRRPAGTAVWLRRAVSGQDYAPGRRGRERANSSSRARRRRAAPAAGSGRRGRHRDVRGEFSDTCATSAEAVSRSSPGSARCGAHCARASC